MNGSLRPPGRWYWADGGEWSVVKDSFLTIDHSEDMPPAPGDGGASRIDVVSCDGAS